MKKVKVPRPIKSNPDPSVEEPPLVLPAVVGFGGFVEVGGGGVDDGTLELLVRTSPPIVLTDLQDEEGGMGCAAGVAGSPWWKVEPP